MDDRWVDVSHEALIRAWPRLRQWIDDDRAGLRLHHQITDAAETWQRLDRDAGALFRGARLLQALEWRGHHDGALNALERDFLDASRRLRDEETAAKERQRRRQLVAVATVAVVAVGAAIAIGTLWQRSRIEARNATARVVAGAAQLWRTRAIAVGGTEALQRSVLLAIESRRLISSVETEQALRASVDLLGRSTVSIEVAGHPAFSPDGSVVAVLSTDSPVVRVVPVSAGRVGQSITAGGAIKKLLFSPNSRLVAVLTTPDQGGAAIEVLALSDGKQLWHKAITEPQGLPAVAPMAFSPDGSRIAAIDGEHAIVLDTQTGAERARITHADAVTGIAFSADGTRFATSSADATARVMTLETGAVAVVKYDREVYGVALSADARLLLTFSRSDVDVYDLAGGRHVSHGDDSSDEYVVFARFSADGASFGTVGQYGGLKTRNALTAASIWSLDPANDQHLGSVVPTTFLGRKGKDSIELWDISTGRTAARVLHRPGTDNVGGVAFHEPSGRLAVADGERIWLYDTGPASELTRWTHEGKQPKVVRSPDVTSIAIVSGRLVDVWDVRRATHLTQLSAVGPIVDAAFSLDGRFLLARTDASLAQIWELASPPREVWQAGGIADATMNQTGSLVATAGQDSVVRMRALPSGDELWSQGGIPPTTRYENSDGDRVTISNVEHATFSHDGRRFAVRLHEGGTRVWDAQSGRETSAEDPSGVPDRQIWLRGKPLSAAFTKDGVTVWSPLSPTPLRLSHAGSDKFFASANGSRVATMARDRVRLWSSTSDRLLGEINQAGKIYVQDVAFSPDGAHAATVAGGTVQLFTVAGGGLLATVTHDSATESGGDISAAEFSPDSRYLVTAGRDRTARVWDVRSGSEVARLNHDGDVIFAVFSADGTRVTTLSSDGQLHVWLWRDTDLIDKACERLTRNLTAEEWRDAIGGGYNKTCPKLP